ncbi:hypothetical protein AB0F81_36110 [Actinoplanes sp. NPDC024001]|uniref:hypothetical protein n=1 Tax=Actinoplanes sp. NPDC024001 TaxID=3154598 RepID=UPI0033DEE615
MSIAEGFANSNNVVVTDQKRLPVYTLGFATDEARQAATDVFYLEELDRQAELATRSIYQAVMWGKETKDVRNVKVWGALQNALFAAICIARLLKPGNVKDDYPGLSANQTKKFAKRRGERLRELLDVADDAYLLDVDEVRNAFEHYDEHLDSRIAGGAECFADWYITDQNIFRTPPGATNPAAVGVRVFFAPGGILYFGEKELSLFELEVELIQMRRAIACCIAQASQRIRGRGRFGGHDLHPLMSAPRIAQRYAHWQHARAEALEALEAEQARHRGAGR